MNLDSESSDRNRKPYVEGVGYLEFDQELLLQTLNGYCEKFLDLGMATLKADGGTFYPIDFLAVAVFNRSISLIKGFSSLIQVNNFNCASVLMRVHLDNLLRFYAIHCVQEPHHLASQILDGVRLSKLKARDGKSMTDKYLLDQLSLKLPWIQSVYEATSAFVHLSSTHIFSTLNIGEENEEGLHVQTIIGGDGSCRVEEDEILKSIVGMIDISQQIYVYLDGWRFTKENPNLVTGLKKSQECEKLEG
jgi:hypothetical protein